METVTGSVRDWDAADVRDALTGCFHAGMSKTGQNVSCAVASLSLVTVVSG